MLKPKARMATGIITYIEDGKTKSWSIGCMAWETPEHLKKHLAVWKPKAQFVSGEIIPDSVKEFDNKPMSTCATCRHWKPYTEEGTNKPPDHLCERLKQFTASDFGCTLWAEAHYKQLNAAFDSLQSHAESLSSTIEGLKLQMDNIKQLLPH